MQGKLSGVDLERIKKAKQDLFLAWWFTSDPKVAKKLYEQYIQIVRLINAQGN